MFDFFGKRKKAPEGPPEPPRRPNGEPRVTLRWLLGLSGQLTDGSNESIRFRENIESPNIVLPELQDWSKEALEDPSDPQRIRALQDLVNSLGGRLGFQVEYGAYDPANADWMPFDGLWRVSPDLYLAVEVFSRPLESVDLKGLERDLMQLSANPAVRGADTVACFVLCQGATPQVSDEIRTSAVHDRIRVLPLPTLFDLLRMDDEKILDRNQLPVLLRPFSPVGVHRLLAFLEDFFAAYPEKASTFEAGASPEAPPAPAPKAPAGITLASIQRLHQEGDLETARERLQAYLGAHPEDGAGWELAGRWAKEAGNLEASLDALRQALMREPGRVSATTFLAALLREQGQYSSALEILDGAGGLQAPAPVLLERAEVLLAMENPQEAAQAAQAAHAGGGDLAAMRLLGRAREASGDVDGARSAYRAVLERDGEDALARGRLEALGPEPVQQKKAG